MLGSKTLWTILYLQGKLIYQVLTLSILSFEFGLSVGVRPPSFDQVQVAAPGSEPGE